MAYLHFNNYYRQLLLSGRLPIPYPNQSPYIHAAPNLSNENCEDGQINKYVGSCGPIGEHYAWHHQYNNYIYDENEYCHDLPHTPYQDPSCALNFINIDLVSNVFGCARNIDLNLLDPWGIVIVNDVIWIANSGTGLITSYNLLGMPLPSVVNVFGPYCNIAQPTGIIYNCNMVPFTLVKGPICEVAIIIVATRDGTINGYNSQIDSCNSAILIDSSMNNSVYTGLEIVNDNLYAVDFYNQRIDVYDYNLVKIMLGGFCDAFFEDPIPCDFTPYNIINIGDVIYVTYARQSPMDNQYELIGPGNGYINIFTLDGIFIKRFASRGFLNTPWGITLAPASFGYPSGSLMVSNFGDNSISIYDPCGIYLGKIKDKNGNDIFINRIRGLYTNPNHDRIIYWTARDNNLKDAYVGTVNIGSFVN